MQIISVVGQWCLHCPYKEIKFSNETTLETSLETADDAPMEYMVEDDLSFRRGIHENLNKCRHAPSQ